MFTALGRDWDQTIWKI